MDTAEGRRLHVGRRNAVQNNVKLTTIPECDSEEEKRNGPKKALFIDNKPLNIRRTLKPLHEINNFQFSSSKSKSYLHIPKSSYRDMFHKHNKIPLSPPSRMKILASTPKKRRKPSKPVLQPKELFKTFIDSSITKFEKAQFSYASFSASNYLSFRHLESVEKNADIFKEKNDGTFKITTSTPNFSINENNFNEFKTPCVIDLNIIRYITSKQDILKLDCKTRTSNAPLLYEEIEELKKNVIDEIHQSKLHCCDFINTRFKEIELEIEKRFFIMEKNVNENYDKLLKKVQDEKNDSTKSQSTEFTVETVKEKNYTKMTGAFGILNNMNTDCSFLKTPKANRKTREEMLSKRVLSPATMSFVLQEQLMQLNCSS